jgi:flagellar basal-body rod modification protein FlgD
MADPSSTSSTDTSSATISANDFLTLLVTEMQNQDPTATTDPNEYINQLVNVNSLEQLIDINQNLSTALGSPSSGAAANPQTAGPSSALTTPNGAGTSAQPGSVAHKGATSAAAQPLSSGTAGLSGLVSATKNVPGNLSIPSANPSAAGVAHALDGHGLNARSRAPSVATCLPAAR